MSSVQSGDFLERVVPEVRSGGGRNIVELAKTLRMPVETTRYKVKGILKRGLSIHASIDSNKFGLSHHYARFHLTQKSRESEKKFFQALADSCYLASSAKRVTNRECLCSFAIPTTRTASSPIHRFLRGLAEEKLIEAPRVSRASLKSRMIQPKYFNLKKGQWQIDWEKLRKEPAPPQSRTDEKEASIAEFDDLDVMIASKLETDALVRLSDIADSLKTTLNNVFYHFHKHVMEGELIEEFVIRWSGTAKQEVMFVQFEFENLSFAEEHLARASMRKLPFLWSDAFARDTGYYVGEAMIPSSHYLEALNFLSAVLGETSLKMRVILLDARTRVHFSLPAHLFKEKDWDFDPDSAVEQVSAKLKK